MHDAQAEVIQHRCTEDLRTVDLEPSGNGYLQQMRHADGSIAGLFCRRGIIKLVLLIRSEHNVDLADHYWDAFEGEHLFTGHDPEFKTYQSRAHLSEIIALLGPPPPTLLARASLRTEFFSDAVKHSVEK
ncbi:hypothetical protein E4U30_008285 [Claviceps sp. LM220 group G6]|nr:hypothetical protein E4U30_008285 [Claviceps sp. LM220 group G6]